MPAYSEALAKQILSTLEEAFPAKLSAEALKTSASSLAGTSEREFFLALDALHKMGLVSGTPVRSGFTQELRDLIDIEITPSGRESLRKEVLKNWTSYYWAFLGQFGVEFYQRWKGKIITGAVGGVGGFFAGHENAWLLKKSTLMGTLLGIAIYTIGDLLRVPWLVHQKAVKQESPNRHRGFAILGIFVVVALFVGVLYLVKEIPEPTMPPTVVIKAPEAPKIQITPSKPRIAAVDKSGPLDRFLNTEQKDHLYRELKRISVDPRQKEYITVTIAAAYPHDRESARLALQLVGVFQDAGWNVIMQQVPNFEQQTQGQIPLGIWVTECASNNMALFVEGDLINVGLNAEVRPSQGFLSSGFKGVLILIGYKTVPF